jgi:hypothetical protein
MKLPINDYHFPHAYGRKIPAYLLNQTKGEYQVFKFRPSQREAFMLAKDASFSLIQKPPGAGKGADIRFSAMYNAIKHPTTLQITAHPYITIVNDIVQPVYLSDPTFFPGETLWNPVASVDSDEGSVQLLYKLLTKRVGLNDPNSRIVCVTHLGLVLAFQRFPKLFKDVNIHVDEIHRVRISESIEDTLEDEDPHNKMGQLIDFVVANSKSRRIRIHGYTATFHRHDRLTILGDHEELFKKTSYYLPMSRFISEECQYLSGFKIGFNFFNDDFEDAVWEELKNPVRTIGWIPHPTSQILNGRTKYEAAEVFIHGWAQSKNKKNWSQHPTEPVIEVRRGTKTFILVDLVDERNRSEKIKYISAAHNGKKPLDGIIALQVGKEGMNWEQAVKSICVGFFNSGKDFIQRGLGRVTRDSKGKNIVEVVNVLPRIFANGEENITSGKCNTFINSAMLLVEGAEVMLEDRIPRPQPVRNGDAPAARPNLLLTAARDEADYMAISGELRQVLLSLNAQGVEGPELRERFNPLAANILKQNGIVENAETIIEDFLHRREQQRKNMMRAFKENLGVDASDIDFQAILGHQYVGDLLMYFCEDLKASSLKKVRRMFDELAGTPLAVACPELMEEWDWKKNSAEGKDPNILMFKSNEQANWIGKKCKHHWNAIISSRANGAGCPFCSGRRACKANSLATLFPKIAKELHPTKNGDLTAHHVTSGSNKKVRWICNKGHEWITKVNDRTSSGNGCPFCSGKRVCKDNSLATLFPKLAKELHPTKNGDLTAHDVTSGSGKKMQWVCENGHEWNAIVCSRVGKDSGCPFCAGKQACKDNSLATLFPKIAKELHPTKNGDLTAHDVTSGSSRTLWWICEDGHEYDATVNSRTLRDYGCPFCAGKRPCKDNSLATLYPKIAKELHPTKNGNVTAHDVTRGSNKKVRWKCNQGHEYDATIASRVNGTGCPFCAGKRVCKDNSLATLFPKIAKELHPTKNGDLTAHDVTSGSHKKLWWKCNQGHEWNATVNSRVNGSGCPFCSGNRVCKDNSLATLFPKIAKELHPTKNGDVTGHDVTPGSGKKLWWICEDGHEWDAIVCDRVGKDSGCPHCYNNRRGKK